MNEMEDIFELVKNIGRIEEKLAAKDKEIEQLRSTLHRCWPVLLATESIIELNHGKDVDNPARTMRLEVSQILEATK